MKKIIFIVLYLLYNQSFIYAQKENIDNLLFLSSTFFSESKITYKIIENINHTFGYDIYVGGKLFIHQTSIPSLSGNDGFSIRTDAKKTAKLVIEKIKKGEVPPTITYEELEKIKITLK